MKAKILGLLAVGVLAAGLVSWPMTVHAALVTDVIQLTAPTASGPYDAGHVFTVTFTYDDQGTSTDVWNDGTNGIAEFGGGDDTLNATYVVPYGGFTLYSNAQISLPGLASLPAGATPWDRAGYNFTRYYEGYDTWWLQLVADSLMLDVTFDAYGMGHFRLYQSFCANGSCLGVQGADYEGQLAFTRTRDVPVPLPAAAWLLLSGLSGLGFLRRRKLH